MSWYTSSKLRQLWIAIVLRIVNCGCNLQCDLWSCETVGTEYRQRSRSRNGSIFSASSTFDNIAHSWLLPVACRDYWFPTIAVILRQRRENQLTSCNFSIWIVADVGVLRKPCYGRETARYRCKIRYVSKFIAASRGFLWILYSLGDLHRKSDRRHGTADRVIKSCSVRALCSVHVIYPRSIHRKNTTHVIRTVN